MKPIPQPCHSCGHVYAGAICPVCKEERPLYTAMKRMYEAAAPRTAPKPYPACQYAPASLCGCEGRGLCLEVA